MYAQIILHLYVEGFYILNLESELSLDIFWISSAFTNHFATFF